MGMSWCFAFELFLWLVGFVARMQMQAISSGVNWYRAMPRLPTNITRTRRSWSVALTVTRSIKKFFLFMAQSEMPPRIPSMAPLMFADLTTTSLRSAGPFATRISRHWCTFNRVRTDCASSSQVRNLRTATAPTQSMLPTLLFTCYP